MRKGIALIMGMLLLVQMTAVVGCTAGWEQENGNGSGTQPLYSFTDSAGNEVSLTDAPENVAVLFSSYAQVWAMSGGRVSITVGDSVTRGFADADTPLVDTGAGMNIDTERLVALKPDFVIGSADMPAQVAACKRLTEMGVACAVFREESFSDYLAMLKLFTQINANAQAYESYGEAVAEQIRSTLAAAERESESRPKPLSVLFVRAGSGAGSTRAKTAENHFVGKMLEELGTDNIADEAKQLSESLSLEQVILHQPDVILLVAQGDEAAAKSYMESVFSQAGWQGVSAVKAGQVYWLPKEMFHYKPNAKWAEAYAYLFDILYPEAKVSA